MSNDSIDDLIKAMLTANQKNKAVVDQKQQEQKAQEEEKRKLLQAIKYQREHLINLLNAVIDKFNQQSMPGEKIVVTQQDITENRPHQTVLYTLPNKLTIITLVIFTLEPSLNLTHENHGFIPLGAYLRGYSSHFLWCHVNNNDRLGKWIAYRRSTSNLNASDLKTYDEEYHLNEKSLRALENPQNSASISGHYEDDVRKEFARVLLKAMQAG